MLIGAINLKHSRVCVSVIGSVLVDGKLPDGKIFPLGMRESGGQALGERRQKCYPGWLVCFEVR